MAKKQFQFSWKISLVGFLLVLLFLRLSVWQWDRYLQKEAFLDELDARIAMPIVPLAELMKETDGAFEDLLHRRVSVEGVYDFEHEVVKRNRKDAEDGPGVHVITPMKIDGLDTAVLVNRGYIPFQSSTRLERRSYQKPAREKFIGLVKLPEKPRWVLAPNDPPVGPDAPWVDAWLRIDPERIQQQLPYPLLPIQIEKIAGNVKEARKRLVQSSSTREEMFFVTERGLSVSTGEANPSRSYPVPAFSTVVPSATHLAYVFEWAFLALLTVAICYLLQRRKVSAVEKDTPG